METSFETTAAESAWVFQANPKRWDLVEKVEAARESEAVECSLNQQGSHLAYRSPARREAAEDSNRRLP